VTVNPAETLLAWLERNVAEIEAWSDRWTDFAHLTANVLAKMPYRVELLPPECSVCRQRHGLEIQHPCE
jgi:hypothetical protein